MNEKRKCPDCRQEFPESEIPPWRPMMPREAKCRQCRDYDALLGRVLRRAARLTENPEWLTQEQWEATYTAYCVDLKALREWAVRRALRLESSMERRER